MNPSQALRILVVDDEKTIRRFLKATLTAQGFTVLEASNGEEALEASVAVHPDAILLDLGLPDRDGIEVTREIRKRSKTPIIIVSVREDESDKIAALDAGADDFLTKPFNVGELLARLRAVMRRLVPRDQETQFTAGKFSVDIARHVVEVGGKTTPLTPTEFDVLKVLVMNAGKVVTRRQLLQEVWNKTEDLEGVSHLLRVTISHLREKIEPAPEQPVYVLTEPGIGYRLRADG